LDRPKQVVETVRQFRKRKHKDRERAKPRPFMQPRGTWISVIVVGIILFFLVVFPNTGLLRDSPTHIGGGLYIGYTRSLARQAPIMDRGWYNSTSWLKDNTPEPFGNPDFYYELYPPRSEFEYPETAYGILSWWDYGYFIMQVGHRIPNANPSQSQAREAGEFFTAQNETSAGMLADELGAKYVMIDQAMATGKFYAMVDWAGGNLSDFYEYYYVQTEQGGQLATLFYPAFYQSMAIRLYNFDGQAVTPATNSSIVISYEERVNSDGGKYKAITSGQAFASYEDAQAYLAAQTSGNHRIVGTSGSVTPVPLEALDSYQRVYPDPADATASTAVKTFEYLGSDGS
jgi:dolichyl-diphosphooligosaccharide--protein glycosyltransferase